jgi:hypothetical protein
MEHNDFFGEKLGIKCFLSKTNCHFHEIKKSKQETQLEQYEVMWNLFQKGDPCSPEFKCPNCYWKMASAFKFVKVYQKFCHCIHFFFNSPLPHLILPYPKFKNQ